jgi:hypothetical protein
MLQDSGALHANPQERISTDRFKGRMDSKLLRAWSVKDPGRSQSKSLGIYCLEQPLVFITSVQLLDYLDAVLAELSIKRWCCDPGNLLSAFAI